jgi:hypothetical protein
MERRQAIAWAGSIALFGCVSTLLLGSLAGGFGFHITQPPPTQAIRPGPLPQPSEERLAPDSGQLPTIPVAPAPETGPSDPVSAPAPASAGTPPAPDPAPDVDYPHAPAGHVKLSADVSISQPSAMAARKEAPAPPRDVEKPDAPAGKKTPAPIPNKKPLRDIHTVDPSKRVVKSPQPQDIEKIIRSKIRASGWPDAHNGTSVRNRSTGGGPKVEGNGGKARGQDVSHDG